MQPLLCDPQIKSGCQRRKWSAQPFTIFLYSKCKSPVWSCKIRDDFGLGFGLGKLPAWQSPMRGCEGGRNMRKREGVEITRSGELLGLIPTCSSSRTRQRLIQETPLATSHQWWGSQDIRKADTKSTGTRGAHSWRKTRIWKYHTNLVLPRQTNF